jgi:hypothetical protein
MASGGTRFTRPARTRPGRRTRPVPRMVYVDARAQPETLYDVLVVSPSASSREVRRVARALRRNLPDTSALPDVCLAEQVLGRAELRRDYDALLARLRAANQPMPRIGVAIEAGRLGPSFTTRFGSAGQRTVNDQIIKLVRQVAYVLLAIIVLVGISSTCRTTRVDRVTLPAYKPIRLPKLDPALLEYKYRPIEIPKIEIPKLEIPKIEIPKLEIPKFKPPRIAPLAHAVPSPPPAPGSAASPAPPAPSDATP